MRERETVPDRPAALITGGARRLGRAIAESLSEENYDIALTYRTSADDAREVRKVVEDGGGVCRLYRAELRDLNGADDLIVKIHDDFPNLSILVNNASSFIRRPYGEVTPEHYREVMDLNLGTPLFLTQAFAGSVQAGHVINLLDTRINQATSPYFIYLLAKKALASFTAMAAKELGPAIRVNAIAPGLILPPEGEDQSYLERLSQSVPLLRPGTVEEILKALHYLIDNTYVTGECLHVDGGQHL